MEISSDIFLNITRTAFIAIYIFDSQFIHHMYYSLSTKKTQPIRQDSKKSFCETRESKIYNKL